MSRLRDWGHSPKRTPLSSTHHQQRPTVALGDLVGSGLHSCGGLEVAGAWARRAVFRGYAGLCAATTGAASREPRGGRPKNRRKIIAALDIVNYLYGQNGLFTIHRKHALPIRAGTALLARPCPRRGKEPTTATNSYQQRVPTEGETCGSREAQQKQQK